MYNTQKYIEKAKEIYDMGGENAAGKPLCGHLS
jgi:hypothetical protein